jgi:lipoprotein-anchoring transpeptidase ErfK/SrfK
MKTPNDDVTLISQAKTALKRGDRTLARRLAQLAIAQNPKNVDAWLLLGGLSQPRASINYLASALELAPEDPRVRSAYEWAKRRLDHELDQAPRDQTREVRASQPPLAKQPVEIQSPLVVETHRPVWLWTLFALLIVTVFFLGLDLIPPQLVGAIEKAGPISQTEILKPSLTPTMTQTPTPTHTPTPTFTPTPTLTSTATFTPTPTQTPTNQPTAALLPTEIQVGDFSGRWIDIDLSDQRLYAYQDDKLVKSFLVSTGTASYPTPVGRFAVWIKFRYDDMSGPGYYLPDVPYTMYFYQDYGIHGTYWHNNFGTPMSHGCVNMVTEEAGWLFNWSYVGIPVVVHE